ncbi:MAG: PQQ-binding-like beta-propeller repeat protein [Gammaproteobacteria bacterium]|nr:PQQ-binding-like beta-propeller repeat protein [Gammaproteobacteria bacterium]
MIETDTGAVVLDALTGAPLWQALRHGNDRWILADNSVVVADWDSGLLIRFDPASGEEVWKYKADGELSADPAFDGERLFVNVGGTVRAIDVNTGEELWNYVTVGDFGSNPVVLDGLLFHPAFQGRVSRLDPETGEALWEWDARSGVTVRGIDLWKDVVAVRADRLNILLEGKEHPAPQDGDRLVGLNAETGAQLWAVQLVNPAVGEDAPHMPAETISTGGPLVLLHWPQTGVVESISIATGKVAWDLEVEPDQGMRLAATSSEGHVFITTHGTRSTTLSAVLASDGTVLWERTLTVADRYSTVADIPVVLGGALYVGENRSGGGNEADPDQGVLRRVDPSTGETLWTIVTRDPVWTSPVGFGDTLLVLSTDPPRGCA